MVMIISGLYSFLWGKTKESKRAARQNAKADEQGVVNIELGGPQLTATVVPSSSPDRDNIVDNYIDVESQVVHKSTEQS